MFLGLIIGLIVGFVVGALVFRNNKKTLEPLVQRGKAILEKK